MLFNSEVFFVFIALFLPAFFLLRGQARMLVSLIASYIFYAWWDWRFLGLIWFSTLFNFYLGDAIHRGNPMTRKRLVTLGVVVNLSFLGFFKYFNFFIDTANQIMSSLGLGAQMGMLDVVLPVGISFYTFQTMSYTLDIYRGKIGPEPSLLRFAVFVAFFPQLVAGPIVRAEVFLPQLYRNNTFEWSRFIGGLGLVLIGYFKKVGVADTLAILVDRVYDNPGTFSPTMIIIACIFYSFQIYCDFSGYSDIAIGLARIMGYDFPENFRSPYFSKNFSEFWTRWHISLSSWLRDYLYIPLGGNRRGPVRTGVNLMLTMLLGGLWHGANWTFVVWGGLHGLYLIVQRMIQPFTKRLEGKGAVSFLTDGASMLLVFTLTTITWIFFRSQTISDAVFMLERIAMFRGFSASDFLFMFPLTKGCLLIVLVLLIDWGLTRVNILAWLPLQPYRALLLFVGLILTIAFLGTFDSQQFIYFQF
jgi:alginate O-acetyltransferase complex protein AlgI